MSSAGLCTKSSPCDLDDYTWIVVLGFFAAFFAAYGIGANDVANAFATSVGSKALTVRQACFLAVVFEYMGAVFLGGEVVKTIRKGIADVDYFADDPEGPALLMWGCLSVIFSVGLWLLLASRLEMPVSTTHSAVGGMIGMAFAAYGSGAVVWTKETDEFPFQKGFVGVIISWFLSPIASGILSSLLFFTIRKFILRSATPFKRAQIIYPILVAGCITIITLFMLLKGIKSSGTIKDLSVGTKVGISFGVGVGLSILLIPAYIKCSQRIESGAFVAPKLAIEVADEAAAAKGGKSPSTEESQTIEARDVRAEVPATFKSRAIDFMMTSLNTDPHAAVGTDEATTAVHRNAERFDPEAEAYFTYLQIFSAIFDAFAHGANDVANAIGPFASLYIVYRNGYVSSKADMGDDKWWILTLGGVGIGVGLLLYGYRILRAIGVKLAVITPSRGFCIEMGSSLVVIIGAHYGWPLSTTHCQVGATMGVALLEGHRGFNKWVMFKTAFGWVATCFIVGLTSAIIFSLGAYAPSVHAGAPTPERCLAANYNYTALGLA